MALNISVLFWFAASLINSPNFGWETKRIVVVSIAKELRVSTAQRYCNAAFMDGLNEDTIKDLASLAAWGRFQSNTERDFHRWMPFAMGTHLQTHVCAIPTFNPDTGLEELKELPVLLASDVLSAIWGRQSGALWEACIGATPDSARAFWNQSADTWASSHPVIEPAGCAKQRLNL